MNTISKATILSQNSIDNFDYRNIQHGTVKCRLMEILKERGISKTHFMRIAQMQPKQINLYCSDTLVRVDLDILARFCFILNCEISDLLCYIPPEES